MIELDKGYDASKYEADIYKLWLDSGYFNPDKLPNQNAEPFTIILPPPNVTGTLHLGHAYEDTLQDILIRFKRMQGRKTLWLPGTDHAAIATQAKVEKILGKEEGKRKTDLGREAFLDKVNKFAADSHDTIVGQLKSIGASVDWSREAYTLDDQRALGVRTGFKAMYDDGLIYRSYKVINWDPKGQTVISDEEIVHEERDATLYTFKYSTDFPIAIATTRPETKVGDTAVAVHPADERYAQYIDKEYDLVFAGVPLHIKIIADEAVEKDFGTGALGVTPAHSMIDAEMAERHNLPMKQVINEFAKMTVGNSSGPAIEGKKTTEARQIIVDWLREQNLLISEEPIKQNIATAERSGGIIEPLPKMQWFMAVNKAFSIKNSTIEGIESGQQITLKQLMRHVVETNQVNIMPTHFSKTYFHWIDNLRDWCISRQLWFGHRIPVWYKGDPAGVHETYCGVEAPEGEGWTQDEDTLDTWFSAGMWTFSTLGWPNQTEDLKTFHPTSVIAPGYEILFFWVARMILMSGYHLGQVPFRQAIIHGMVRDKQGRKFSKSLNNGIDPIDMMTKYGTDALRFALISGNAVGNDIMFDEQKVKGMKHFGNKLWNIARYILGNLNETSSTDDKATDEHSFQTNTDADKKIIAQLQTVIEQTHDHLEKFRLHEAAQGLYQFVWYELADVYIEASKAQLQNEAQKKDTQEILLYLLKEVLKLLHPFIPFVTEVLWQELYKAKLTKQPLVMMAEWPSA